MLVPLFNLVTHRPDLIIDHLAGYLTLAQDELNDTKQRVTRRAIAGAVALVFGVAFIVLAGMALMLASLATTQTQPLFASTPMLIAVPSIVLIAAIIAATIAIKSDKVVPRVSFADHVQRDIQAFRQVIRAKEEGA
jgi:cytochrome bd-type quinol oxidase subunit 2